jgi:hypothetical protein
MSQLIFVWRGWRIWVVAVRLSGTLALAGTMQLAQAQQTSPEIAFRSTTWNALHTELGRVAPPVGWAFVMTRNGQEIFVDQGGFSRAPWESSSSHPLGWLCDPETLAELSTGATSRVELGLLKSQDTTRLGS